MPRTLGNRHIRYISTRTRISLSLIFLFCFCRQYFILTWFSCFSVFCFPKMRCINVTFLRLMNFRALFPFWGLYLGRNLGTLVQMILNYKNNLEKVPSCTSLYLYCCWGCSYNSIWAFSSWLIPPSPKYRQIYSSSRLNSARCFLFLPWTSALLLGINGFMNSC